MAIFHSLKNIKSYNDKFLFFLTITNIGIYDLIFEF